jgi:ABC-2 type transport system ATP-binding protein
MAPAITVEHLRKTYGEVIAVNDASFDIGEGEIFGIVGPNGSGKTTTVECLQGLRLPTAGKLRVLGLDPTRNGADLRHRIGSQLQESALPDRIKVWEALDLFAATAPGGRGWRQSATDWGLYEKRTSAFANLSGGQRQRLFIALALIRNPQLVFLDEMTTGLDPIARREAWALVEAVRERGATIVLVTHFMEEAERLCDRVAVFKDGRVRAVDSPSGLVVRHATSRTVKFSCAERDLAWLRHVPGAVSVEHHGDQYSVLGSGAVLAHVGAALIEHGLEPADLRVDLPTLEDAYMSLTGAPAE